MIYLNNAATSYQRPPEVARAMVDAMEHAGSYGRGAHESELRAMRVVESARSGVAALLGADRPERVCFMHNATAALNCAISGLVRPGDRVVATDWDHNSVLRPLYRLASEGVAHVDFVPADRDGQLDLADFERLVTPGTRMVVMSHASNLTGDVSPVAEVAGIAHARGALLVLDCAQTAGCHPVDMVALGADVICFTGHKSLMGPQGTGGIVVGPDVDVRPFAVGGTGVDSKNHAQPEAYPEHLEAGTLNMHGIAGLEAGVRWIAERGIDAVAAHDRELTERFVEGARSIDGARLLGSAGLGRVPGAPVVSLNLDGWLSDELADALSQDYDIAVRAGIHCAPRMHRAVGTYDAGAVRFSFGAFTTNDDVDAALAALRELAAS